MLVLSLLVTHFLDPSELPHSHSPGPDRKIVELGSRDRGGRVKTEEGVSIGEGESGPGRESQDGGGGRYRGGRVGTGEEESRPRRGSGPGRESRDRGGGRDRGEVLDRGEGLARGRG